jgi:hypothetical protein
MKTTSIFSKNIRALATIGVCSLAVSLFAGCGGSTPPAEGAHEHHAGHEHGKHGGHEHHEMTGPMREMHDVLAPLWHAEKSPEREVKTCEAVPTFTQRAEAIEKNVPESAKGKEAAYQTAAKNLVTAVAALGTECAKAAGSRSEFEAKFHDMHEAFHKVMESAR